jgi:hypothetical protein
VKAAAAVTLLGFLLLTVWTWRFTMDDAFISFRYVKHLAEGVGPVWNLADRAQPVEGFTSSLHVWLLGLLYALTDMDVPVLGKVFGVSMTLILAGAVAAEVYRRKLSGWSALVALSFLVLPVTVLNTVSGMETPLYMLLNWLSAVACLRLLETPSSRLAWLFVFFGLLTTLTRPEFVPAFGLMAAYVWWLRPSVRASLVKAIVLLYIVPGMAVTAWRYAFFGDIVPNAFHVKQGRGISREGLMYVARFLGLIVAPYLLIIAWARRSEWTSQRHLLVVVGINLAVSCLYFSTTVPLMGWWSRFLIAQAPLLALCAAVVLDGRLRAAPARRTFHLLPVAAAAVFVLSLLAHVPVIAPWLIGHAEHEARYREVGRRLRPFAADSRWMVYHDVGSLVYESEWNTVDVVGLNTRRANIQEPCVMRTDLVLTYAQKSAAPLNPCENLYVPIAELPFFDTPSINSVMRIYARHDLDYAQELGRHLAAGWPQPFTRDDDWVLQYSLRYRRLFFE